MLYCLSSCIQYYAVSWMIYRSPSISFSQPSAGFQLGTLRHAKSVPDESLMEVYS